MAKTENTVKEEITDAVEAAETNLKKVTDAVRKGALAYVGLHGVAYDRFQERRKQLLEATDGFFGDLVERGEKIEAEAGDMFKETRTKVENTYTEGFEKVRGVLPASADNRVEELEAEIASLNKKIVAMGKKAKATVKTTTQKVA